MVYITALLPSAMPQGLRRGSFHRAAAYLQAGEGRQAGLGSPIRIWGTRPGLCVAALAG